MVRAIVVGSGPNGLAAAVTLAMAGVEVNVLEASDHIGGGTRSSELTVPGLIHDDCSGFHPLALGTPFAELASLEDYGLQWAWPHIQFSHPLPGGSGGAVLRSLPGTVEGLGRDGRRWDWIFGPIVDHFEQITADFMQPLARTPSHPLHLARFGIRSAMPTSTLAAAFSETVTRALFAGLAAHAMRPFSAPFSAAIGTALGAAAHVHGWPVAVGGSSRISDAMVAALKSRGGTVTTNHVVRSHADIGEADIVMLDVAPAAAVAIMGETLPARVRRALLAYRHGPAAYKVDFAVDGSVPWEHRPSGLAGTVHLGGSFEQIRHAERDVARGKMPREPFILVGQQFIADPSRSHAGLNPVYAYAHVPAGYDGDATEAIESGIERYAPGFRDRIVAKSVRSTSDLAAHNPNYVGGDIVTGLNSARQLMFRPRVAVDPYWLGRRGVYLCSAATPPGAGAHGMCGFNAARSALRRHGVIPMRRQSVT